MTEQEINSIEHEHSMNKKFYASRERDPWIYIKLSIGIFIASMYMISLPSHNLSAAHPRKWPMPDTWRCSNCGYENYEGIGHCAICGTRR